jgi:single-stranded-DNA-specific exonuclease
MAHGGRAPVGALVVAWRADRVSFDDVVRLQDALGCSEMLAWILVRRGLGDADAARAFLDAGDPGLPLWPAEDTPGIGEAADRLVKALRQQERIVVHGDYDCDGITSTAILVEALRARGADVRAFLPSRFTDGYGVAIATVERLAEEGCDVLVCVDCGTTAVEALARAAELGMAPIVCDHHLAGGVRPAAILANPALGRGRDDLPAAAGVVFDLVRALAERLDGDRLAPASDHGIDLVALATVADAVPLIGRNRQLVARGLAVMRTAPRPGIEALCRVAGVATRSLDARHLGFTIAPCLNAAGRMAHPDQGLELLLAGDATSASSVAEALWQLNLDRRDVERGIVAEAVAIVEASPDDEKARDALVVVGDGWHEGVVGIVASRLVERFGRPTIVLTRDGYRAKGSGRSLPGVDLHALVRASSERLVRWGGHQGAVGLELHPDDVRDFRERFAEAASGVRASIERARIKIVDAVVSPRELTLPAAEEIQRLAPFGRGNPEVRLAVPSCEVVSSARVGQDGRHLELRLRAAGATTRAIGFGHGDRQPGLDTSVPHDAIVRLEIERYQELVGPRTSLEALEPVGAKGGAVPAGMCRQACDVACPDRTTVTLDCLDAVDALPEVPPPLAGAPRLILDRRGQISAVTLLAALVGADSGAVAVVSDVARRRAVFGTVLEPTRLGAEASPLVGRRCEIGAATGRLGGTRGAPVLAMVEYSSLPNVELPPGVHVVLVDPPSCEREAEWALARADGRTLHLAWGADEVSFARQILDDDFDVRAAASDIWRALKDGAPRPWGPDLDRLLLGEGSVMRPASAAARAIAVLQEIGMVSADAQALRVDPDAPRRDLATSERFQAVTAHVDDARAFLDRAMTLHLEPATAVGPLVATS